MGKTAFPKLFRAQNDSNQVTFYPEQLNEKADKDSKTGWNNFQKVVVLGLTLTRAYV